MDNYDMYERVCDYLSEAVYNGELSEDDAYAIESEAYDRYIDNVGYTAEEALDAIEDVVFEGNAFNKRLNNLANERDEYNARAERLSRAGRQFKSDRFDDRVHNYILKAGEADSKVHNERGNYVSTRGDRDVSEARKSLNRQAKQDWMSRHNNKGTYPEERYKPGRYLRAQQELNRIKNTKQY